jgi:hypothetical protein
MASEALSAALSVAAQQARRRRVRRSALTFGAIAAAFYLGFIVLILIRGR